MALVLPKVPPTLRFKSQVSQIPALEQEKLAEFTEKVQCLGHPKPRQPQPISHLRFHAQRAL